tara:strand:+ start:1262 stop:1447 length:186 start_codon:yes stop_codon:yes gene_type:complete
MKTSQLAGANYSSSELLQATKPTKRRDGKISKAEKQRRSWARKFKLAGFTVVHVSSMIDDK